MKPYIMDAASFIAKGVKLAYSMYNNVHSCIPRSSLFYTTPTYGAFST